MIAWVTWSPKLFSYCPRMNSNKKSLLLPFLRWKKTTHQCTAVLLIKTFAFPPFEFTSNLLFFKIESNQLRTKIKKKLQREKTPLIYRLYRVIQLFESIEMPPILFWVNSSTPNRRDRLYVPMLSDKLLFSKAFCGNIWSIQLWREALANLKVHFSIWWRRRGGQACF